MFFVGMIMHNIQNNPKIYLLICLILCFQIFFRPKTKTSPFFARNNNKNTLLQNILGNLVWIVCDDDSLQ